MGRHLGFLAQANPGSSAATMLAQLLRARVVKIVQVENTTVDRLKQETLVDLSAKRGKKVSTI